MKKHKVIAIAGASSGTGKAMAIHLAKNGYAVSICARREMLLQKIADSITHSGGKVIAIKADMTLWNDVQHFIRSTVDEFGRIDALINNVGAGIRSTDFEDLTVEEIDTGIAINLTSVLYGCKAVLPIMKKQSSGHIINVSSILGKRARSGLSVYTAGKHGVEGFSRALLNEVNKYGIKVSIFGPAAINTDWANKAGISLSESVKFLDPESIAQAIKFLIETPDNTTVWNIDLISMEQTIDPI